MNYFLLRLSDIIIIIHTLSVDAFLTLRTLTPLGKWNSWFSKSVLKNVFCVRGSVKDMPTSLTTDVLSFSTLSLVVPCWNTTWKTWRKERSSLCAHTISCFMCFCNCSVFTLSVLCVSHRVIVADKKQVLVLTTSDCALVQWVNDAHVRLLFEAQQAALMELHTVAAIRTDPDHCPYYQSDLRDRRVVAEDHEIQWM